MTVGSLAAPILSDRELVLQFESLGDNCELGVVQRRVEAEPLGLFRFAGAPLRHLIRAMEARFEGMADPGNVRVQPERDEYMIELTRYDFNYHAHVKIGEMDPERLLEQQMRTVPFLIRKLMADLEEPEKIFVFRQNETVSANDLLDLRAAMAAYGAGTLLWVQEHRPGHPPGTVVAVDDRFMVGYVSRLARRENVPDLDLKSWLTMLRAAYTLHAARTVVPPLAGSADATPAAAAATRSPGEPVPSARRVDTLFGRDGNAAGCLDFGWSGAEDGYTWSVDDRSGLTIPCPDPAEAYDLEMDVVPYVSPPAIEAQVMDVVINGHSIRKFAPLPRGTVRCTVPGHVLDGQASVNIVLEHPDAISPEAAAGENDQRRLAVAFYRLSLIAN